MRLTVPPNYAGLSGVALGRFIPWPTPFRSFWHCALTNDHALPAWHHAYKALPGVGKCAAGICPVQGMGQVTHH